MASQRRCRRGNRRGVAAIGETEARVSAKAYEAAFVVEPDNRERFLKVYGEGRKQRLESTLAFCPEVVGTDNFDRLAPDLGSVQFAFSTWGMPNLSPVRLDRLASLRAVFYAAGSVQGFARPLIERGVTVVSSWRAIALPVSAFAAGQVVLAAKGYFAAIRQCRTHEGRLQGKPDYPGVSNATIAILGAGTIGTMVIERLKPLGFTVVVFDPFLDDARAARLGVRKVSLEQAFASATVVTNHIADLPATRGMLKAELFRSMPRNATFVNTARGATVDEQGLLDVLQLRPDLTALLDVTSPEPPLPDSRIYRTPNLLLTPHIAGSLGREILAQADMVIEDFERYRKGTPVQNEVTLKMLETMA
jgi:phosphoglycerate dehydrogenase-like enzyme